MIKADGSIVPSEDPVLDGEEIITVACGACGNDLYRSGQWALMVDMAENIRVLQGAARQLIAEGDLVPHDHLRHFLECLEHRQVQFIRLWLHDYHPLDCQQGVDTMSLARFCELPVR